MDMVRSSSDGQGRCPRLLIVLSLDPMSGDHFISNSWHIPPPSTVLVHGELN